MSNQPLAEVFGFPINNNSREAVRSRQHRLCPFGNKVPNCTKDKANDPLGVCSVFDDKRVVITCPIRFRQEWIIAEDAASFFFPPRTKWTALTEVKLNDKYGESAGNIDAILASYDDRGKVTDFGALEVQAVYISGNVRNPFEHYMQAPARRASMDWSKKPNYPNPDYLSSQKRLTPQLIFKGGILKTWNKKTAVALNRGFFETLPKLEEVKPREADIAWFIYDLKPPAKPSNYYELFWERTVYTKRPEASAETELRMGESMEKFVWRLEAELDEVAV